MGEQDIKHQHSEEELRAELEDLDVREDADKVRGGVAGDPDEGGEIASRTA